MESRMVPPEPVDCECGRAAMMLVDGVPKCHKHKPRRKRKTIEWDQLSILGEPPKRERASWLE